MMNRRFILSLLGLTFAMVAHLAAAVPPTEGKTPLPFVSPLFGDHMVLQRNKPNRFWGWTEPGKTVSVEIENNSATSVAAVDGKWMVTLDVPAAGGPYAVKISGPQSVVLHDVLVGDVWLCSGQSNMTIPLRASTGGVAAAQAANDPELRLCTVAGRTAYLPVAVPRCDWQICTPETAAGFSAVAYYFAHRLQEELHVPIGLINASVGGSPAESWMSAASLTRLGEFTPQLAEIQRLSSQSGNQSGSFLMHWLGEHDLGDRDAAWAQPALDESTWQAVILPGGFSELGVATTPSVCWFRRTITLPPDYVAGAATLFLGEVEKMDTTYVNGHWIGASSWVENPRAYPIPAGTLHAGKNILAVRVFKTKANGGFRSPPETLRLKLADGTFIPLAGAWLGRLSVDARPPFPWPLDLENYATMPTVFANGMIAPLAPLALTGVIWYQGEANQTRPAQYRKLLPALIRDWRAQFGQGDIPFYVAGLPAFMAHRSEPSSDGWTAVREAQAQAVAATVNTGLAVTLDTGEADNIHPKEKRTVGERLARCALAGNYHQPMVASGPIFRSLEKHSSELTLHFDTGDGTLVKRGATLGEFSVAGADHRWHWAQARMEGESVVVSSPDVPAPIAARYAWQANPIATLFNGAGLPATSFRTDDWPLDPDQ